MSPKEIQTEIDRLKKDEAATKKELDEAERFDDLEEVSILYGELSEIKNQIAKLNEELNQAECR